MKTRVICSVLILLLAMSSVVFSQLPSQIYLSQYNGIELISDGKLGSAVACGDVNGDGYADIIGGAYKASPNGQTAAGKVFIVFGGRTTEPIFRTDALVAFDPDALQNGVVKINGMSLSDRVGTSAACADINNDGFADVIIGAPYVAYLSRGDAGAVFVIYGGRNLPAVINLDGSYPNMTTIYGANGDNAGWSVSTGNVNGDEFQDVIVGAPFGDSSSVRDVGRTYVVYGQAAMPRLIDLDSLSLGVTRIYGERLRDNAGTSVAAGDVNNDGLDDVVIGADRASPSGRANAWAVYVVYGQPTLPMQMSLLLPAVTIGRVYGSVENDALGSAVYCADITGDGYAEVFAGAPFGNYGNQPKVGKAYIIYGSDTRIDIDLKSSTRGVTEIVGTAHDDQTGNAFVVANVDGNRYHEAIIAAYRAGTGRDVGAGITYMFYGANRSFGERIFLNNYSGPLTEIFGINRPPGSNENTGYSLAKGDINKDGYDDILIGALLARQDAVGPGRIYVIYGSGPTTAVEEHLDVPNRFSLEQNYPNPFNPKTVISYELGVRSYVTLKVFDVLGREVTTLVNEWKEAGRYNTTFDIRFRKRNHSTFDIFPSGVYFYRLVAGKNSETKRMILLR
jgi:hypothetical protein